MAVPTNETMKEHAGLIDALKQSYATKDDLKSVRDIQQLHADAQMVCSTREQDVLSTIRALTQSVERAKVEATYPERETTHAERVAALAAATGEAEAQLAEMEAKTRCLEQACQAAAEEAHRLHVESAKVHEIKSQSAPRARHEISLYAHITNIVWRFDDEAVVAGTVSDSTTKDIRSFAFDPQQHSRFELINQIWSTVG